MSYLGPIQRRSTSAKALDDISSQFNSVKTVFTLQSGGVAVDMASPHNLIIKLGTKTLRPVVDYTVSNTSIRFTTAPATGNTFFGVVNLDQRDGDLEPTVETVLASVKILAGSNVGCTVDTSDTTDPLVFAGSSIADGFGSFKVRIGPTTMFAGNSTANVIVSNTGITFSSALGLNANTTDILENRGGQLFFEGQRVAMREQYAAIFGYVFGGFTGASVAVATADRITFSTSATAASTVSNLSQARYYLTAVSDAATYGYALGGSTGANVTTGNRIAFSTSITAALASSNLSQARNALTALSDGAIYGYASGGTTGGVVTTTDRIVFSTSATAASTVSDISSAQRYPSGISDGAVYGYVVGGDPGTSVGVTTANRILFSTGVTAARTGANLSVGRTGMAGLSDGEIYGYALGGLTGAGLVVSVIADRVTFSSSTTAASTVSNLSQARNYLAGSSDGSIYGYALGGTTGALVATADRVTFSTSATAASTVSNLSQARSGPAGLSDGAV